MSSSATLPCSVREWFAKKNHPPGTHVDSWTAHIDLLEFALKRALFHHYDHPDAKPWHVIATHSSRGLGLPIYEILPAPGVIITMRTNWSNWMVSVELPKPLELDFLGLDDPSNMKGKLAALREEGWPGEIFPPYPVNRQHFTVCLPEDHLLFTFFWILAQHHGWGGHAARKL